MLDEHKVHNIAIVKTVHTQNAVKQDKLDEWVNRRKGESWRWTKNKGKAGEAKDYRAVVVVAQLAERSLQTPEVRGSIPVIGKNFFWTFTVSCIEKTKIKKRKRPGMTHLKKDYSKERTHKRKQWPAGS